MGSDMAVKRVERRPPRPPSRCSESIVAGINSGQLERLMALYETKAAFATEPGSLVHGAAGIGEALNGFISMNGTARPPGHTRARGR